MQPQGKCDVKRMVLYSAISRQAKASKLSLAFWLNEIVLKSAISRQAKASKLPLAFWLNEIVGQNIHNRFSYYMVSHFRIVNTHCTSL